ncbi:MAG: M23 family metallopeptidase [Myxococcota bacterium]|nr:M23 family metallopeptidase [Myxococcota bacterium]
MTEPMFEITSYNPKTQKMRARLHPSAREVRGPWRWPLQRVGNRNPIVLAEHTSDERRGVDLGYAVASFDSELFVPVHAAQSGEVSFAIEGQDGCAVSIDHGGWTTHYGHMSKMFVTRSLGRLRRRQYVRAGDVIGNAARSPLHIRFELHVWTDARGFVAVDPVKQLEEWIVTPTPGELRTPLTSTNDNEAA